MAHLVTANSKLFSKSTDQELSESVVKVSGNPKFTRLDVREQWCTVCFDSFEKKNIKMKKLKYEN